MLIIRNRNEIMDEIILEDGQAMTDLENSFVSVRETILPFVPQIQEAASPYWNSLKAILDAQDRLLYSDMVADFEIGIMPIALTFVLAFVLNVEPVLTVWRAHPGMDVTAQEIFNNAIVKNRIFENIAEGLGTVIDNSPESTDLIRFLQNFGLAPDNWYLEIGAFNLHGIPINPGVLNMLSSLGYA